MTIEAREHCVQRAGRRERSERAVQYPVRAGQTKVFVVAPLQFAIDVHTHALDQRRGDHVVQHGEAGGVHGVRQRVDIRGGQAWQRIRGEPGVQVRGMPRRRRFVDIHCVPVY